MDWKDIPGYEGLYMVSTTGQVMSLGRWAKYEKRKDRYFPRMMLKTPIDATGYPYVRLTKDKRGVTFRVHQLMAMAFLEKREGDTQVCHLNDIRTDNRIENLRWGTHKDNSADKFRNGYNPPRPETCKRNHPLTGDNEIVRSDGKRNCRECSRAYQYLRYHNGKVAPTEDQFEAFFREHGYKWVS